MAELTLDAAQKILDAAFAHGKQTQCKPLTVAVLDAGGQLKAFMRQDGSSIMRPEIAFGKAWGALGLGMSSRALGQIAADRPAFMQSLTAASGGRMIPVPGGVLVRDGEAVVGAVGVTGDTSDKDEACAVAGIEAAGLAAGTSD